MTTNDNVFAHIDRDQRLRAIVKIVAAEAAVKDAMLELELWPEGRVDGGGVRDEAAFKYLRSITYLTSQVIEDLALAGDTT